MARARPGKAGVGEPDLRKERGSESSGLRQRKKERIREEIIASAWRLFRERGFDATTVEDIAAGAEISRRTFFRYFPTKEAVVFHRADERYRRLQTLALGGPRGLASVKEACLELAADYAKNKREVLEQYHLIGRSPTLLVYDERISQSWLAVLTEGLTRDKSGRERRRARILAGAILGAMRAVLSVWADLDGKVDLVALGRESLHIFRDAEREERTCAESLPNAKA